MNRVYRVETIEDNEGSHIIGAKSRNKAKVYAMREDIGNHNYISYISYKAKLVKNYDNKVIETETNGYMEIGELMLKGYRTWWACEKCGKEDCFDYAGDTYGVDLYKCRKCGAIYPIPYFE